LEVSLRTSEIIFADKTTYDTKSAEWVNRYLTLVRDLEDQRHELPPELQKRLDQEHECFPDLPKRAVLHFTHIQRMALPYDAISGGSDFSPQRIEQLMAQGYSDAKSELKAKTKLEARAKVLATRSVSEATRLKQVYSAASDSRLA
jgi:Patatin phospholipase